MKTFCDHDGPHIKCHCMEVRARVKELEEVRDGIVNANASLRTLLSEAEGERDHYKGEFAVKSHDLDEAGKGQKYWENAAEEARKELLKFVRLADDLTGKIGGPKAPVDPAWEDEFVALDVAVGEYRELNKKRMAASDRATTLIACQRCGNGLPSRKAVWRGENPYHVECAPEE